MNEKYPTNWELWGVPLIIVIIFGLIVLVIYAIRWYIQRPMYKGIKTINGKIVVITGGNTGIGKETARELTKRGAKVIILCRNVNQGRVAAEEISQDAGDAVAVYPIDLSSLESVRSCAENLIKKEPKIDILINNAGVMLTPYTKTEDEFELQFSTNYLGHFLLTLLLVNNIIRAAPSRIINVSAKAHEGGAMHWDDLQLSEDYNSITSYRQSKLANILFTKSLAEKLKGTGVTTYTLHPGVTATNITRHIESALGPCPKRVFRGIFHFFGKTPKQGSQTSIFCAVEDSIAEESGKYYSDCAEKTPSSRATDTEDAEQLWDISLKMTGLQGFDIQKSIVEDKESLGDHELIEDFEPQEV